MKILSIQFLKLLLTPKTSSGEPVPDKPSVAEVELALASFNVALIERIAFAVGYHWGDTKSQLYADLLARAGKLREIEAFKAEE